MSNGKKHRISDASRVIVWFWFLQFALNECMIKNVGSSNFGFERCPILSYFYLKYILLNKMWPFFVSKSLNMCTIGVWKMFCLNYWKIMAKKYINA